MASFAFSSNSICSFASSTLCVSARDCSSAAFSGESLNVPTIFWKRSPTSPPNNLKIQSVIGTVKPSLFEKRPILRGEIDRRSDAHYRDGAVSDLLQRFQKVLPDALATRDATDQRKADSARIRAIRVRVVLG